MIDKITDRKAIITKLAKYNLDIPEEEQDNPVGFSRIIEAIKRRGQLNPQLAYLKIDLGAFEQICHEFGLWDKVFGETQDDKKMICTGLLGHINHPLAVQI